MNQDKSQYQNIELICLCGEPFIWTAGEQAFLQGLIDDGKTNKNGSPITFMQPKRCKECRIIKKQRYETQR